MASTNAVKVLRSHGLNTRMISFHFPSISSARLNIKRYVSATPSLSGKINMKKLEAAEKKKYPPMKLGPDVSLPRNRSDYEAPNSRYEIMDNWKPSETPQDFIDHMRLKMSEGIPPWRIYNPTKGGFCIRKTIKRRKEGKRLLVIRKQREEMLDRQELHYWRREFKDRVRSENINIMRTNGKTLTPAEWDAKLKVKRPWWYGRSIEETRDEDKERLTNIVEQRCRNEKKHEEARKVLRLGNPYAVIEKPKYFRKKHGANSRSSIERRKRHAAKAKTRRHAVRAQLAEQGLL